MAMRYTKDMSAKKDRAQKDVSAKRYQLKPFLDRSYIMDTTYQSVLPITSRIDLRSFTLMTPSLVFMVLSANSMASALDTSDKISPLSIIVTKIVVTKQKGKAKSDVQKHLA